MPNEIDIAGLLKDYAELDGLEGLPFWAHKTIASIPRLLAEIERLRGQPNWRAVYVEQLPKLAAAEDRLRELEPVAEQCRRSTDYLTERVRDLTYELEEARTGLLTDKEAWQHQAQLVDAAEDRISILEHALDVVVAERDALKIKLAAVRDVATAHDVRGAGGFVGGQKYVQGRLLAILETISTA